MERNRNARIIMAAQMPHCDLSFNLAFVCKNISDKLGPRGFTVVAGREIVIRQVGHEIIVTSQNADGSDVTDFNATG